MRPSDDVARDLIVGLAVWAGILAVWPEPVRKWFFFFFDARVHWRSPLLDLLQI